MPELRSRPELPHRQDLSFVRVRLRDARPKQFVRESSNLAGSVTVSGRQGLRVGLILVWDSAWAIIHKSSVTFSFWDDVR